MGDSQMMEFSNNPADYNRVLCMACTAKIKVLSRVLELCKVV